MSTSFSSHPGQQVGNQVIPVKHLYDKSHKGSWFGSENPQRENKIYESEFPNNYFNFTKRVQSLPEIGNELSVIIINRSDLPQELLACNSTFLADVTLVAYTGETEKNQRKKGEETVKKEELRSLVRVIVYGTKLPDIWQAYDTDRFQPMQGHVRMSNLLRAQLDIGCLSRVRLTQSRINQLDKLKSLQVYADKVIYE